MYNQSGGLHSDAAIETGNDVSVVSVSTINISTDSFTSDESGIEDLMINATGIVHSTPRGVSEERRFEPTTPLYSPRDRNVLLWADSMPDGMCTPKKRVFLRKTNLKHIIGDGDNSLGQITQRRVRFERKKHFRKPYRRVWYT